MRRNSLPAFRLLAVTSALAAAASLTGCASLASSLSAAAASAASSAAASAAASGTTGGSAAQQGAGGLVKVHDPKKVTYSRKLTTCHFRDGGKLPDSACTPGAIDPSITQRNIHSTICRSGYTTTVRPAESQTEHAKFDVAYPAYHVPHSATSELDHLVSLELGGANDIANLWPEVGKVPNPKDKVENTLHRAVCDGKVSLAAAQQAIASNWTTAESRLGLG